MGKLFAIFIAFLPWWYLIWLIEHDKNQRRKRLYEWLMRPKWRKYKRSYVRCGCGWWGFMRHLSPDGHCPGCGFSDDFEEIQMQSEYWERIQ